MNQAQYGRGGDTQLVHMRPDELKALGLLAQATTGSSLTTNPQTGYAEAFRLPTWVLPVAAIAATALTAGAAAPVAAGALGAAGAGAAAGSTAAAEGAAALTAAEGAGGILAADTQAGLLAAQEAGLGSGALGWGGAETGFQGGMNGLLGSETGANVGGMMSNLGSAYSQYGKPAGQIMSAANQGAQMAAANDPPPMQAPPQRQVAKLDLSGLLEQSKNMQTFEQQEQAHRRAMMARYSGQIGRV